MSLRFRVTRRHTAFLDPFHGFERRDLEIQVREDPLTGHVARILQFRARPLGPIDHSLFLKRAAALK